MTDAQTRLFRVYTRHLDTPHAHVVTEVSFEAAAVAYLEAWADEATEDGTASVIVRDLASGHEHCFRLDLVTGATAPCD
jgi:hypothetical protein